MPHFFISSNTIKDGIITVSDENNYKHIAKSLRAKIGENLLFIDENQIQHECIIEKINSKNITAKIIKSQKCPRKLDFELYLAQSPLRSDAQNTIVEKATELGIRGIYPLYTDNCTLSKDIIVKKIPKWQKIMFEASKQCERADIPGIFELTSMETLLKENSYQRIIVFAERNAEMTLKSHLRQNPILKGEKILAIIGPEGGFSKREFEYFKKNNLITVSLGNLVLKAETAVTVALGNIIYEQSN